MMMITSVDIELNIISFLDSLIVCHLPYGPTATFTVCNTIMRHDIPNIGTMSEAYPHLIFHNFKTKLGQRVKHRYCYHKQTACLGDKYSQVFVSSSQR